MVVYSPYNQKQQYNHDWTPYTQCRNREKEEKKKWSDRQVLRGEKSFTKLTHSTLVLFFFRSIEEAGRVSSRLAGGWAPKQLLRTKGSETLPMIARQLMHDIFPV